MKKTNWLIKALNFFSPYEGPFEKKLGHFLKTLKKRDKSELKKLIQSDLIRLSIYFEYRFKAYKKLKKSYRKKLYQNAHLIRKDFKAFYAANSKSIEQKIKASKIDERLKNDPAFLYLLVIMTYLKPGKRFKYRESSSLEKLLRDPAKEVLVGDCNQICTLYIYLFALQFPVENLQLKLLPGHVCLHYKGQDIETTTGELKSYQGQLIDIEEVVATNLLDISDPEESQYKIGPKNLLKAAEFAFKFSSHRSLVQKNLFTAYHNLALYYVKANNFKKANLYANKSGNTRLQKGVKKGEATYYLKQKNFKKALKTFQSIQDKAGEKAAYQGELNQLIKKTKSYKTLKQFRDHKTELKEMRRLAQKINHDSVVKFVDHIFNELKKDPK